MVDAPDMETRRDTLPSSTATSPPSASSLLRLPPELLGQIFQHLPAWALARVRSTCRRMHVLAGDDLLWSRMNPLQDAYHSSTPSQPNGSASAGAGAHAPFGSWREMLAAHAPYWFLIRHRLWFADRLTGHQELIGQLALATYDDRMGEIELLRLQAHVPALSQRILLRWPYDPRVLIFDFRPRVSLEVNDPVLHLELTQYGSGPRLKKEVEMPLTYERFHCGIKCRLMLTRAIPSSARVPDEGLWPPSIVPHVARVRRESPSRFSDPAHKPDHQEQVCETAFRTRMWTTLHGADAELGYKIGEEVATWSTLPPEAYRPTPQKPYQGIWVGDYAMHGAEFILIIQKTPTELAEDPPEPIVEITDKVRTDIGLAQREQRALIPWSAAMASAASMIMQTDVPEDLVPIHDARHFPESSPIHDSSESPSGRIEAIKLTGDPNVPRGRHTFIAEDIGPDGLVRVATERPFGKGPGIFAMNGPGSSGPTTRDGARVVRAWGQVGSRGFAAHGFMAAQLILDSPNRLALYWTEMGTLVWYRRVDWEGLLSREREEVAGEEEDDEQEAEYSARDDIKRDYRLNAEAGRTGTVKSNKKNAKDTSQEPSTRVKRRNGIVWDQDDYIDIDQEGGDD